MDNCIIRGLVEKTHDDGDQQAVEMTCRFRERLGGTRGVPRIQSYGFSAHTPVKSHFYSAIMEGNPDMAQFMGGEDTSCRPRNLLENEWKHYHKNGAYCHAKSDMWKWQITEGGAVALYKVNGDIHLNPSSAVLLAEGHVLRPGETSPRDHPAHRHHISWEEYQRRVSREAEAEAEAERVIAEAAVAHGEREAERERVMMARLAPTFAAFETRIAALEARITELENAPDRPPG
jgi:hypothetical protein